MHRFARLVVTAASALIVGAPFVSAPFASGCTGTVGSLPSGPNGAGRPGERPGPGGGPGAGTEGAALTRRLVLLSPRHYANAVTELLELEPGTVEAPANAGGSTQRLFSGSAEVMTRVLAFELQSIAEDAAAAASTRLDPFEGCTDAEDACLDAFVLSLARRAFRRPLGVDESRALLAVRAAGHAEAGRTEGLRWAIEAILQSTSFLYRTEYGTRVSDGVYELRGPELAAALGFYLRDSLPDDALLDAGESGRLDTPEGLASEVDRLLADPDVQARLTEIVLRWLDVPTIDRVVRSDPAFTPELRAAMHRETERFVSRWLWSGSAELSELLTSSRREIDPVLAEHYGVSLPAGATEVDLGPDRAGILTHASVLAGHANGSDTSVVHRGLFIGQNLLCLHTPPPSAQLLEDAADDLAALTSERARSEYRRDNALCAGCHANIDPFGLALEGFDEIGRAHDRDATARVMVPASIAGPVEGASELGARLATSSEVAACIAWHLAGAALDRRLEDGDTESFANARRAFVEHRDVVRLFRDIAVAPAMRTRLEAP